MVDNVHYPPGTVGLRWQSPVSVTLCSRDSLQLVELPVPGVLEVEPGQKEVQGQPLFCATAKPCFGEAGNTELYVDVDNGGQIDSGTSFIGVEGQAVFLTQLTALPEGSPEQPGLTLPAGLLGSEQPLRLDISGWRVRETPKDESQAGKSKSDSPPSSGQGASGGQTGSGGSGSGGAKASGGGESSHDKEVAAQLMDGLLMKAISERSLEEVQKLLNNGAKPTFWHVRKAIATGSLEIVRELLARGVEAKFNHIDDAIAVKSLNIVERLLSSGVKPEFWHIKKARKKGLGGVVNILEKWNTGAHP